MRDDSSTNEIERFNVGEVWRSPQGTIYVVENIGPERSKRELLYGKKRQATLRKGLDGKGRRINRDYDAILGWARIKSDNSEADTIV